MNKVDTTIIISINVHEKVSFLLKQIKNIQEYVLLNYYIILNCNEYMYNELKGTNLPSNVLINKKYINKERFTGTITQGIYSNLECAIKNYNFKYFIVLSSRNLFYNILCDNNLDRLKIAPNIIVPNGLYCDWHWNIFSKTQLGKYYIDRGINMYGSCHEGLVFNYVVCQHIFTFLETNTHIRNDLFKFPACVEEFALQTISMNEGSMNEVIENLYKGFGCINESFSTCYQVPDNPNFLVYKTDRT